MKTLKLNMVLAMMTFTMACLAPSSKCCKYLKERLYLRFDEAMQNKDLVLALYQQEIIRLPRRHREAYLAATVVDDTQYIILGSYEQWKNFYSLKWDYLLQNCPQVLCWN
jgi:hypothetical protein